MFMRIVQAVMLLKSSQQFFGSCALILDALKTLLLWPYNICKNAYHYFSPGQTWSKLQFTFYTWGQQYENVHTAADKIIFIARVTRDIVVSLFILAFRLPKMLLGAALAILNPFQQTDYMRQQNELQAEKAWLKQELNLHGLAKAQNSDPNQESQIHGCFTARYRRHLEQKCQRKMAGISSAGDNPVEQVFAEGWQSVMTFFNVTTAETRRVKKQTNCDTALRSAGSNYVMA